jgi:death-on-curing protein
MPCFVTTDEVLRLHRHQIDTYGGSHGVRDAGLLDSALAQPQAAFGGQFAHDGLAEMAAAYLFHLAMNHPFFDGNKRISVATAIYFLEVNGVDFDVDPVELGDLTLAVAAGQKGKDEATAFFRAHVKP